MAQLLARHLIYLLVASALTVHAQSVVNGQIFTPGLAIVDAPAVGSTHHVGSAIPIAIEISGNGHLPPQVTNVGNNTDLPTRFDALEIYMVSSETTLNVTVSNSTSFLTQEVGSTVKHLDFWLPICLTAGHYNFTIYESSHINGTGYFTITPIPITIESPARVVPCTNLTNQLADQPQLDSPPSPAPYSVNGSVIVYSISNAQSHRGLLWCWISISTVVVLMLS